MWEPSSDFIASCESHTIKYSVKKLPYAVLLIFGLLPNSSSIGNFVVKSHGQWSDCMQFSSSFETRGKRRDLLSLRMPTRVTVETLDLDTRCKWPVPPHDRLLHKCKFSFCTFPYMYCWEGQGYLSFSLRLYALIRKIIYSLLLSKVQHKFFNMKASSLQTGYRFSGHKI